MKELISVHFIHKETGRMISKRYLHTIPRIGEDVRMGVGIYYKVDIVCWAYDEDDTPYQRVNIGLIDDVVEDATPSTPVATQASQSPQDQVKDK